MDMTSLATFGTFVLAALGAVAGLYKFSVSQRDRRDAEVEARALAKFNLAEVQRKLDDLERLGQRRRDSDDRETE